MARPKRVYGPAERFALMLEACQSSPYVVERERKVPAATIYTWFSEFGGLPQVRALLQSAAYQAQMAAVRAIYDQVSKRAPDITDAELMQAWRALWENEGKSEAPQQAQGQQQAQALVVNLYGDDRRPEANA